MSRPPLPDPAIPTYDDAPEALIGLWNQRRRALSLAEGEALPALDVDLKSLLATRVPEGEVLGPRASAHAVKRHEIRQELVGFTELAALNGLLIAHLRKKRAPRPAARLFRRIWAEEADALLAELPPRWLISSAITFGDHGGTEDQRRIGLAVNVLFSLMKLYEFERLYSGTAPDAAFPLRRRRRKDMVLDLPGFSLLSGGLDVNLLAQIWDMARDEPVVGRIACHLLDQLNRDPRSLFRRLGLMRTDLVAIRAEKTTNLASD
ncbi:hypothetical protein [Xinfangfangia pollutisoli]|uniref:hypothetical protein n=1 Tax=Xinfangfangia pollutisoli TaxID=2865960 RepID=UPI001CD7DFFD|nr:hypothetical protein [Xinfangfangia pollutisoli]